VPITNKQTKNKQTNKPLGLNSKIARFVRRLDTHIFDLSFVYESHTHTKKAIISLYSLNWLVSFTKAECLHCLIQTKALTKIQCVMVNNVTTLHDTEI